MIKPCIICGTPTRTKLCSDECRLINERNTRRRLWLLHAPKIIMTCGVCGSTFESTAVNKKIQYCSKECSKKHRRQYSINYTKNRIKTDPTFKLKMILRSRLSDAIKKQFGTKAYKSIELLGCTIEEARQHIEQQFTEGMTWDNHGIGDDKWHIDHIIPCASFDLTDKEQQKLCFHYTNLQPLWQPDNLKKSDKI